MRLPGPGQELEICTDPPSHPGASWPGTVASETLLISRRFTVRSSQHSNLAVIKGELASPFDAPPDRGRHWPELIREENRSGAP